RPPPRGDEPAGAAGAERLQADDPGRGLILAVAQGMTPVGRAQYPGELELDEAEVTANCRVRP
ncbi:MAG: hypothetical protein ACR2KV_06115, partial [Solirubrobacteraceae bacterium]